MPAAFDAKLELTCSKLDRTAKKLKKVIDLQGHIGSTAGTATERSAYKTGVDIVKRSKGGAGT